MPNHYFNHETAKNQFQEEDDMNMNYKTTENGALAHKSTNSAVYDMFAFGGAYRNRSDEDVIALFKKAFEENAEYTLKCLFYLRDCRCGQGERRFFRLCFKWLAQNHRESARILIPYISFYGRWDDVIYSLLDTPLESTMACFLYGQVKLDLLSRTPSLLGKWLPSENASSETTKAAARTLRKRWKISSKQYRKILSTLRRKINVLERLMSANEWDKIEFDKIPSKAGLIYKNAFARRDIIAEKYSHFAANTEKKVNAYTLYPYEVVKQVRTDRTDNKVNREMINKYWKCLPDYFQGKSANMLCVVDTSGSMYGTPMDVATSLGLYCAQHNYGPFINCYISFSSRPIFVSIDPRKDFYEQATSIMQANLCDNTNLTAVFDLILKTALKHKLPQSAMPETIIVISDMEIDVATGGSIYYSESINNKYKRWTKESTSTEMETLRAKWASMNYKLPKLIYWNVNARNNTILDASPDVSYVSGNSPVIFKSILTGKTGYDLMLETLLSNRYSQIIKI